MLNVSRCKILLFAAVIAVCVLQNSLAAVGGSQRLVSPDLLKSAGLKILWENALPTKTNESLERLLIFGDRLYAVSDKNYMLCLERNSGTQVFGKDVTLRGLRIGPLSFWHNRLISTAGSQLYEIDPNTGNVKAAEEVEFGIVCPVACNSNFYYLSGTDRRLHAYHVADNVHVFKVAAENDSMITTILADETFVVFGTDQGNVISIDPNLPVRLWQFNTAGAIAGAVIQDGMSLYFASEDMYVYRLDIVGPPESRRLVWKYLSDGILKQSPRVTKQIVYQCVYNKALTAIDKDKGAALWTIPGGLDLLAEANGKAYVMTKDQTIVIMDNASNKRLFTVNCAGVTIFASNTADSKIYIADKSGKITCLQPVD